MEKHLDICQNFNPDCHFNLIIQPQGWEDFSLKEIVRQNTDAVEREMLSRELKKPDGTRRRPPDYSRLITKRFMLN